MSINRDELYNNSSFVRRHIGPSTEDIGHMLEELQLTSFEDLAQRVVPANIRTKADLKIGPGLSEFASLSQLKSLAQKNQIKKSFIGMGYSETFVPPVVQRNLFENPGWYTAYTPYQAEISQGRLESLLNFQTMVMELTGMEVSNASLLDEGTAAAEAITLAHNQSRNKVDSCFVDKNLHPHVIEVLKTRSEPLGIQLEIGSVADFKPAKTYFAALFSYPQTDGQIVDLEPVIQQCANADVLSIVDTDLLMLALVKPPGELGADIVIGNTQRFGVPLGNGGPHASFLATKDKFKRSIPGRIIGVSIDKHGKKALRLALQTREQHIRREKATSNICTAQVLLANMAAMYAIYHGPAGLTQIANRVHALTLALKVLLEENGSQVFSTQFFDTLRFSTRRPTEDVLKQCAVEGILLRHYDDGTWGASLAETTLPSDLIKIVTAVTGKLVPLAHVEQTSLASVTCIAKNLQRKEPCLSHAVFQMHQSETQLMRYMHSLQSKDMSLVHSMVPLGSCTMKLNSAAELLPVSWPEFNSLHPFAPIADQQGYVELYHELCGWLKDITGFAAVSLQPNAGSQGEYAGLLVIRKYFEQQNQSHRTVCLIPSSAHGTNPASAVMVGYQVVVVQCDAMGNIDVEDLKIKAELHKEKLAALMVTYPSTHGVFEESIVEICQIIHQFGGQVYMDGANLNALVGLCRPGEFGADVAHLNLHKTFAIPHGGGGPGVGPIGVAAHLAPYLPVHPMMPESGPQTGVGPVTSAPWGSASILPISYAYIAMMGSEGLLKASLTAILNANYIAHRLRPHFPILYTGKGGWIAHECIIDVRPFKQIGVSVDDIAKRLMDYGFHAPTMSWPVAGTLMIEPTESESLEELDKFCDAMIQIRKEIQLIEDGTYTANDNPLSNAPHDSSVLIQEQWNHCYSREVAAFPLSFVKLNKYWPPVSRIDNVHGDKNLVCSCPPLDSYHEALS